MSRDFIIIDETQRSPRWFAARLGRLTGSVAGDMLSTITKGEAAGRRNLRLRLVLERLTGIAQERDFTSSAMETGIEREDDAFAAYQAMTGEFAERSGFLAHRTHMAGCSLDGHLGDFDVLVSIKCRQPAAHYEHLKSGTIPASAMAQMRHELWITGAREHHYFSFNPDFRPALRTRLVTVTREQADVPAYEAKALAFLAEVDVELAAMATLEDMSATMREVMTHAV